MKHVIEEKMPLYWQRRGVFDLELRAITYTYENGKERTRKLKTFSVKRQLDAVLAINLRLEIHGLFENLERAYWDKAIDVHPANMNLN
jgi:hypothetical protein